ncbi:uncharacterized protein MELLADRAFT_55487 [Melampsora larici-populina 98AG31]|uniref:Uncharacterized protein n=1 Tax=Melampsora larici-populina (strain 98AG31 / pathotype 3-4-7) TaxID=747676 RepID=F4RFF8_MELLP|nr:uncharacterized protein MELLADRAFT_55487 [Melampsora larici-populina 98AG31]EGG08801.1 hypothetical protein MELLADRAFT_55487 [Melampsora larici-populina 98AG31]
MAQATFSDVEYGREWYQGLPEVRTRALSMILHSISARIDRWCMLHRSLDNVS